MSKSEGNGSFFLHKVYEMNEKFSFKVGVKLPLHSEWVRIFRIYCMNYVQKSWDENKINMKISQIKKKVRDNR